MPLFDALHLPGPPPLPADLFHPADTDAKPPRQLGLCALARGLSSQDHPSQIVIVRSRHIDREENQSFLILTLKMR
jgi:hypothetical protein